MSFSLPLSDVHHHASHMSHDTPQHFTKSGVLRVPTGLWQHLLAP